MSANPNKHATEISHSVIQDLERMRQSEKDGGVDWPLELYISKREVNGDEFVKAAISYNRVSKYLSVYCLKSVLGTPHIKSQFNSNCYEGLVRLDVPYEYETYDYVKDLIDRVVRASW